MLEQYVLEYGGFSSSRGRCHVVVERDSSSAMVGNPGDNPGTSVTNAIEQVAYELSRTLDVDVTKGRLYEYQPWEPAFRRERTLVVEFRGDAWSMPVWTDASRNDPFVKGALELVHKFEPYLLATMKDLKVVNPVVRVRIDAVGDPTLWDLISDIGSIAHVSQRRWFYVDVEAETPEEATAIAREKLGSRVEPGRIKPTTPNAPLDQPESLPLEEPDAEN
jgi:hypothetical protein